jgi:hypothetical protein
MGVEDLYDLLEIQTIDAHNRRVINKKLERDAKRKR